MNMFYLKLKTAIKLLVKNNEYINKESYYPTELHKSKKEMIFDQLYFLWKYGDVEKFYFTYGFDRKEMTREKICDEYILNEKEFLGKIDKHNSHINRKQGRFSGRCIVSDKFYFYLFLKSLNIPTPKILYYTRNGKLFYSEDKKTEDIGFLFDHDIDGFAKPYGGQLGNGAFALHIKDSKIYVNGDLVDKKNDLIHTFKETNYIVQEKVVQHPIMNKLCSSSLNTIRLHTLITENEEVVAFGAGMRMGREGSIVDNWAKGGVFVGIDMSTGCLMKTGFIKPPYGTSVTKHPDNGLVFENFEIPYFKEAVAMAKELHSKLYRIHSVGWDIAITENGPMFIEGNSLWEISMAQTIHGGLKKQIEKYFD